MNKSSRKPLFSLGRTVATPGALAVMRSVGINPFQLLLRHQLGDWDDLDAQDRTTNDRAVVEGARILSAYETGTGKEKIWIITEADRSVSTLLLPSEY